jgi:acyl-ACP thioesterase
LPGELRRLERRQDCRRVERLGVPYSSIDLNGHVNNTEYVRWGFDSLRRAFKLGSHIRSVQATYLSEVFEADELEIAVASDGDDRFHVLASKPDEDTAVYLMEVVC